MRVHGDKVIRRRPGISELNHYTDAKDILRADFFELCGYCGKSSQMMYQRFQIDHFVPKTWDPDRKNDYYNLVLCCAKCNQIKSNKWPTEDITKPNDGEKGFIDPATEEFDLHLARDDKGHIVGLTPLGENMCKSLHFDIRRTELFWRIGQLYQHQRALEELFVQGQLKEKEKDYYIKVTIWLKKYISQAVAEGE